MQSSDAIRQTTGNSNFLEYLERLNFLYWCSRFPEEVKRYAGHATFERLREKYKADISRIEKVARICSGLEEL